MYNNGMFDITATCGKYDNTRVLYENFFGQAFTEFFRTTHLKLREIEKVKFKKTDFENYSDECWE